MDDEDSERRTGDKPEAWLMEKPMRGCAREGEPPQRRIDGGATPSRETAGETVVDEAADEVADEAADDDARDMRSSSWANMAESNGSDGSSE